jgi:ATP-dependent Lon protease
MAALPQELGIFPLPDVVLFPGALLPLHVVEPEPLALLADSLASHRHLVLAVARPGESDSTGTETKDVYPIACMGKVVRHELRPDGHTDLVMRGCHVVEIEEFIATDPFCRARIKVREQEDCFISAPGAKERVQELYDLLELACPGSVDRLKNKLQIEDGAKGGLALLHLVAMYLPVDVTLKLEWLACPGSLTRWRMIRKKLCELASTRSMGKICLERYSDLCPENPQSN